MNSEYQEMLEDCLKRIKLLNEWESNFINSLIEQSIEPAKDLTSKQIEKLNDVWEKATNMG